MLPTLYYVKVKHIMNVANILQNARRALVPMRKATIDALLLTAFIVSFLVFTGVLFSYPWLIVAIYVLTYLLAVVLRLLTRKSPKSASSIRLLQFSRKTASRATTRRRKRASSR